MATERFVKGNCECCDKTEVIVSEVHSMMMCNDCRHADEDATARAVAANSMVQQSRSDMTSIEIKVDIFNAATTSAHELKASIDADPNIPDDSKDYAMASESLARFKQFQDVIFGLRKEASEIQAKIAAKENEMRAWQVQIHTFAGNIRDERKEKFRNFDIQYQPKPAKVAKAAKAPSSTKKFSKTELIDAAAKYKVPMAMVQMVAVQRNMTADQAAHEVFTALSASKKTN
jgi:hypothetical protein